MGLKELFNKELEEIKKEQKEIDDIELEDMELTVIIKFALSCDFKKFSLNLVKELVEKGLLPEKYISKATDEIIAFYKGNAFDLKCLESHNIQLQLIEHVNDFSILNNEDDEYIKIQMHYEYSHEHTDRGIFLKFLESLEQLEENLFIIFEIKDNYDEDDIFSSKPLTIEYDY